MAREQSRALFFAERAERARDEKAIVGILFGLPLSDARIVRMQRWPQTDQSYELGSFTPDRVYSYDQKFYAAQSVEQKMIQVSIYTSDDDQLVFSFVPARAWDFWGICWESDTYNIWTQSGDIGVYCYKYDDMRWIRDEDAKRPDDIISKYDD